MYFSIHIETMKMKQNCTCLSTLSFYKAYFISLFLLHWVFSAVPVLSLVVAGGHSSLRCHGLLCGGFSLLQYRLLGMPGKVVVIRCTGSDALRRGWDLPGPGVGLDPLQHCLGILYPLCQQRSSQHCHIILRKIKFPDSFSFFFLFQASSSGIRSLEVYPVNM